MFGNSFQPKDSFNFLTNMMGKMNLEEEEPEVQTQNPFAKNENHRQNCFHNIDLEEDEENSNNTANTNNSNGFGNHHNHYHPSKYENSLLSEDQDRTPDYSYEEVQEAEIYCVGCLKQQEPELSHLDVYYEENQFTECEYCHAYSCKPCTKECEGCGGNYCKICINVSYEKYGDRLVCLNCLM